VDCFFSPLSLTLLILSSLNQHGLHNDCTRTQDSKTTAVLHGRRCPHGTSLRWPHYAEQVSRVLGQHVRVILTELAVSKPTLSSKRLFPSANDDL
jgi:hypothetical protein